MMIVVRCESCGKGYKVNAQLAGRQLTCKACGATVFVPALERERPPEIEPPAPEPIRPDEDDDDLLALKPAVPAGPPARVPTPFPTPFPMPAAAAATGVAPRPVVSLDYGHTPQSQYVTVPGERHIDRFAPLVLIGTFVLCTAILWSYLNEEVSATAERARASADAIARAKGFVVGYVLGFVAMITGIVAPLCLLGVFVASRVMGFANRPLLYVRCLTVICVPMALEFAINGFRLGPDMTSLPWYVALAAFLGMLWLLLRLRAGAFAVSAGFVLLFAVGVPVGVLLMIIGPSGVQRAMAMGKTTPPAKAAAPPPARPAPRRPSPAPRPPVTPGPPSYWGRTPSNRAEFATYHADSEATLRKISAALDAYVTSHDGRYPTTLIQLQRDGALGPQDLNPTGRPSYVYPSARGFMSPLPAKLMLAWEAAPAADGMRTVLFGDGRVATISPAEWGEASRISTPLRAEAARRR